MNENIEVTAIHSHMLDEQPRLFFVHFWANDDAVKLAKGLRAARRQAVNSRAQTMAIPVRNCPTQAARATPASRRVRPPMGAGIRHVKGLSAPGN
jgi:Domain of Unknown Function (DUF1259)